MYSRYLAGFFLLFAMASSSRADMPWNGPGPRPPRPMPHDFAPQLPPRLIIERDASAAKASLILPGNLYAAAKPADARPVAQALPKTLIGLALVGSLIAGGLWLARTPRPKHLLGVMLPLLGFAIIAAAVQAQPARLDPPRAVLETGKVRISRDANALNIRLVLPNRPAAK